MTPTTARSPSVSLAPPCWRRWSSFQTWLAWSTQTTTHVAVGGAVERRARRLELVEDGAHLADWRASSGADSMPSAMSSAVLPRGRPRLFSSSRMMISSK